MTKPSGSKFRFRFRLRTLVILVTLIAAGFGGYRAFVAPYVLQNEIRLAIKEAGGAYETRPAPRWVQFLCGEENVCVVTKLDLADNYYYHGYELIHCCDLVSPSHREINCSDDLLAAIANLTDLQELNVSGHDVDDELVASWSRLTRLQSLNLADTLVADPRWPDFPDLRTLDLSRTAIGDDQISALLQFESLAELSLDQTRLTDEGAQFLRHLPRLECLYIAETGVTEASYETLKSLDELMALCAGIEEPHREFAAETQNRSLTFPLCDQHSGGFYIEQASQRRAAIDSGRERIQAARESLIQRRDQSRVPADPFARSDWTTEGFPIGALEARHLDVLAGAEKIERLDLESTYVRDQDLKHLANIPNLRGLDLSQTWITDRGLAHLPTCESLQVLRLVNSQITSEGIRQLPDCEQLQVLTAGGEFITDDALQIIADCDGLQNLDLSQSNITAAGLAHLAGHPSLVVLDLPDHLPSSALKHLYAIPNLQIVRFRHTKDEMWPRGSRRDSPSLTKADIPHIEALAAKLAEQSRGNDVEQSYANWWSHFSVELQELDLQTQITLFLLQQKRMTAEFRKQLPRWGLLLEQIGSPVRYELHLPGSFVDTMD